MFSRIYTSKVVVAMTAENYKDLYRKTGNSCHPVAAEFFLSGGNPMWRSKFCTSAERGKTNNEPL